MHFVLNVWNESVIDTFRYGSFVRQKHCHGWLISCCPEVLLMLVLFTQLIILLNCAFWYGFCGLSYERLKGFCLMSRLA
jgi:hypothetical protein